jgi:nucleotide-binding universal stress UspA family protein
MVLSRPSTAVAQAGALAKLLGVNVHLVCAFRTVAARAGRGAPAGQTFKDAHNGALAVLEEGARRLGATGVRVENHAVHGDAATALLEAAEANHAQLIVVGSKGMSGARRYLLGSVPNKVSHHASCNVLIVRTA